MIGDLSVIVVPYLWKLLKKEEEEERSLFISNCEALSAMVSVIFNSDDDDDEPFLIL